MRLHSPSNLRFVSQETCLAVIRSWTLRNVVKRQLPNVVTIQQRISHRTMTNQSASRPSNGGHIGYLSSSCNCAIILVHFYNAFAEPLLYLVRTYFLPKEFSCKFVRLGCIVLASAFTIFLSTGFAVAQASAKQDMKAAGTDTKNAAKDTGHAVSTGTKKAYHKTANGTETAADKTAAGTRTAYHKTANGTKTATDKTVNGTKTVGKDVGHGTKVAAQDTAKGTKKVGDKIAGKPTPQ